MLTFRSRHRVTAALVALGATLACREPPSAGAAVPGAVPEVSEPRGTEEARALRAPPAAVEVPSLAPLVERILPTVVSIEVNEGPATDADEDEDEKDGDASMLPEGHPPVPGGAHRTEHAGAGVLVGGRGLVLTSFHFIRDAASLVVHLASGSTLEADLVGRDGPTDLALLRIRHPPRNLSTARLGDSRSLHPGDWVLAVGNPFGLASSVSLGVVSAVDRQLGGPYDGFLQTDAAINPGSSGGPLFDLQGRVVGIATAYPRAAGVGFAIPSALVSQLLPHLEHEGGLTRGALGALLQEMTPALGRALGVPSGEGALVSGFTPDSAAERAGVRRDDVVVALDGQPVGSRSELIRVVALHPPASEVRLTLVRDGNARDIQVTLGARTDLDGTGPLVRAGAVARSTGGISASLGLGLEDLTPRLAHRFQLRGRGAVVVSVSPGSAAEAAGFSPGAVLTEIGGRTLHGAADAEVALRSARGGPAVLIRITKPGGAPELRALTVR